MKLLQAFRERRIRSKTPWWLHHDVLINDYGIQLRAQIPGVADSKELRWQSISKAYVFKQDLLTTDLICLAIMDGDTTLEANEEMPGWENLIKQTEQQLEGSVPYSEWWPRVFQPAFQESLQVIYEA